ncbi:MAG: hypothetical protein ACYS0C_03130 [Planctomycetota bacterium]|jgi:hypothetical protein
MGRVTIIISVCFLATLCLGQEGSRYHNSKEHFSFELPEEWEAIPLEELPTEHKQAIDNFFPKGGALGVCRKIGNKYLEPPYILVQGGSIGKVSETVFDEMWRSTEGRDDFLRKKEKTIRRIQNAEGYLPKSWKGAKLVEKGLDYDAGRHISFETLKFYHTNVGRIVVATVRALGSHRIIVLRFYLDGNDAENFTDIVEKIMESFSYDKGYMFGETKGENSGFIRAFTRKAIWYSILFVGGISILYMILERWVKS